MKRSLAALLAVLQVAWSLGPGALSAFAQTVNVAVPAVPVQTGATAIAGSAAMMPVSPSALSIANPAVSPAALSATLTLPTAVMPVAQLGGAAPAAQLSRAIAAAGQARVASAGLARPVAVAEIAQPAAAGGVAAAASRTAASLAPEIASNAGTRNVRGTPAQSRSASVSALAIQKQAANVPGEAARGAAGEAFAALTGERLIRASGDVADPVAAAPSAIARFARTAGLRAALPAAPRVGAAAPETKVEPAAPLTPAAIPSPWGVRAKLGLIAAGTLGIAAAAVAPLIIPHAATIGVVGSIALTVIGIPQIVRNFKTGREGVKDLVIASPLIWFAAATLLSIASIGRGSSMAWNAANVAGVVESAAVVGQINWYKRDKKELRATLLTAAATLAPIPLIAMKALMPLTAWADLAFTAAMGLLWILNWPQIRRNYKLFKAEGRAPTGIAPAYPALVAGGSLLHLFASLAAGDMRWAMNAIIAIVTAGAVLAQIYFPSAANAALGPLVRLQDRATAIISRVRGDKDAIAEAFKGTDLARFAGTDGEAKLAEAVTRAKALPGRSVIFLEAPTAAGKSTLAKSLEGALGMRIRSLEVDRYFKPAKEVPHDASGQPDFDRPDAMYLDRVAADIRTLLAGGRIELPVHDMATSTTRFDSGEFMTLAEDEVLVVDSIFASHPLLRAATEGRQSLTLYLEAPAVVRLQRRLARDKVARGKPVMENLRGWARILQDERENILPYRSRADVLLNMVKAGELQSLWAAYSKLVAEEPAASREETGRLMAAMIRASLEADGAVAPR